MFRVSRFVFVCLCLFVIFSKAFAFEKKVLTVYEDANKISSIEQAARDFASLYECTVNIEPKSVEEQMSLVRNAQEKNYPVPDVFVGLSEEAQSAIKDGVILPLDFMSSDKQFYTSSSLTPFESDSGIYASPRSVETSIVFYNKKLLLNKPKTIKDYRELYTEDKKIYPILGLLNKFYYGFGFLNAYGAYLVDDKKKGSYVGLNKNDAKEGFKALIEYTKKYMPVADLDKGQQYLDKLFISDKALSVINGSYAYAKYKKSGIDVGCQMLPVLDNFQRMSAFYKVKGYMIPKNARQKDLAEKFIRFINLPDYAFKRYLISGEVVPLNELFLTFTYLNDEFALSVLKQCEHSYLMPDQNFMADIWGPANVAFVKSFENIDTSDSNLDECVNEIELIRYERHMKGDEAYKNKLNNADK